MARRELSPNEKLSAGRLMARERMPYFAAALHALTPVKVPEGSLGTFGVMPNSVLLVDDAALRAWKVEEVGGVLVHEALHIIRDHDQRRRKLGAESAAEARLWNLAADCEINDDLAAAGLPIPGSPVFPKTFGLADGRTAEEYFGELRKQASECPVCGGKLGDDEGDGGGGGGEGEGEGGAQGEGGEGDGDGEGGGSSSSSSKGKKGKKGKGGKGRGRCPFCSGPKKPQAGGGWCGSGGGVPVPGEPERKEVEELGRSEVELGALRRQTAEAVREAAEKSRGTVPAGLVRWADGELAPPRVDWRTKLAQVARTAVAFRLGAVDFRYHRPSRRQSALGIGVGKPVLPALVQPVPQVGIAIDTSGSMSAKELSTSVSEAGGILRAVGAEVTFLACDASVGAVKKVRSEKELAESLVGGGGTDFAPVFRAVEKLRPRPEILVYATDGCGPAPAEPPAGLRVIWLLVGSQRQRPWFPAGEWGDFVEVDDLDEVDSAA